MSKFFKLPEVITTTKLSTASRIGDQVRDMWIDLEKINYVCRVENLYLHRHQNTLLLFFIGDTNPVELSGKNMEYFLTFLEGD